MKSNLKDHIVHNAFVYKKLDQNGGRCPVAACMRKPVCVWEGGNSRHAGRMIVNNTYRVQPFLWAGQRQISQTGCCWPRGQKGSGFSSGWRQKGRQQVGSWSCDPPAVPCWQPWRQSTPSCWVEVVALPNTWKIPVKGWNLRGRDLWVGGRVERWQALLFTGRLNSAEGASSSVFWGKEQRNVLIFPNLRT